MATAAHSGQFHEKGQDCAISNGSSDLTTTHLYYADTYLFSNNARVVAIEEVELNGVKLTALVLDQTVMHPQGGELNLYYLTTSLETSRCGSQFRWPANG